MYPRGCQSKNLIVESIEVNRSWSKSIEVDRSDRLNQSKSIEVIVEAIKVDRRFTFFFKFWLTLIGFEWLRSASSDFDWLRVILIDSINSIMNVIEIRWTVNFLSVIKVALKFHSNRLSLLSNHCQQDKLFSLKFFYIFWTVKSFYKNTESYPKVFLAWFLEIPSTQDLFKDWRI